MEKNKTVLTMDFGTQSLRVSLIDKKGNIVAIVKKQYNPIYYSEQKGYAEQHADFYWDTLLSALSDLADQYEDLMDTIVGSTITTFRDTSVQLDHNLKPVRRSILWLDQRMAKAKEKMPLLHSMAFHLVGMWDTIKLNRQRTMAHWIKENEPEVWSQTYKYVNISAYLTYKLTGNLVDSVSSVTGHYPIDFKNRTWYKQGHLKGRIYGIPNHMLCDLKQPGEILGEIKPEVAMRVGLPLGIKVYATGSDKSCETLGLGALTPDIGAISYGTASTIDVSNPKFVNPEPFLPAYPAAIPNLYNMEVQIYRGYWMITWFSKEFANELYDEAKWQNIAIEELMNQRINRIPPGSDGLVLQPYWGPGLSRPISKGAIVGFSDIHTRDHLYRAIIEGIAYALREGLEGIEKAQRKKVRSLMISGGGSQSDIICQITADVFGLPVSRVQTFETTSLGAAIATFMALGEFPDVETAVKKMVHPSRTFVPNEVANQQYNRLFNQVYLKLYPKLKKIYRSINGLPRLRFWKKVD